MKNIQIIDRAENATFSLFQATDEEFDAIFPGDGQDMEKLNAQSFQPPNGFNVGWYQNDQVEQLLVQARANPDPAGAAKTYQQIEKILNDDVARIYVLHSLQPKAFNKKVRGFVNPHSWAYTFNNVWLAQ